MNGPAISEATGTLIPPLSLGSFTMDWSRTYLMGVVNVTPDSFSDGGQFYNVDSAVAQGLRLVAQGADLLDIGGESTRPGAEPVSAQEELARVLPVIEQLRARTEVPLSIDTYKASVAAAACDAGATLVNDVSGLTLDPSLAAAVAKAGAALVIGHIRGTPQTMQQDVRYGDLITEVGDFLAEAVSLAVAAGVPEERIILDPGIGFGKSVQGNLQLLRGAGALKARLGRPVLVGPSRKAFIGKLTGAEVEARLPGTLASLSVARMHGANIVRVHDVSAARQAAVVVDALLGLTQNGAPARV